MADKTDAEIAQGLRDKIRPYLEGACVVMDEARAAGVILNFQIGWQIDANQVTGKTIIQSIPISRPL